LAEQFRAEQLGHFSLDSYAFRCPSRHRSPVTRHFPALAPLSLFCPKLFCQIFSPAIGRTASMPVGRQLLSVLIRVHLWFLSKRSGDHAVGPAKADLLVPIRVHPCPSVVPPLPISGFRFSNLHPFPVAALSPWLPFPPSAPFWETPSVFRLNTTDYGEGNRYISSHAAITLPRYGV
jgi:hypothetical protein